MRATPFFALFILCAVSFGRTAEAAAAEDAGLPPDPENTVSDLPQPTAEFTAAQHSEGGATGEGGKPADCPCEKKKALQKAAATAYKDPFYNNNFNYLCDPCYDAWHLGENLKRKAIGDWATVDVGGQYRLRYHHEQNIRNHAPTGLGLTGFDDDFLLQRTRVYVNAQVGSRVRIYGEMLDAVSEFESSLPRTLEENRAELQNLFVDLVALETDRGKLTARVGRQELLYGNQRVVSPLEWANTRRTFEGAKLLWQGEDWDIDGFWVQPMRRDAAHVKVVDPPNQERAFYGVYSTYKGFPHDKLDLYWLAIDYTDVPLPQGYRYDTLGGRYWGNQGPWLYEVEGGVQFGENPNGSSHSAGFFTLGGGRKLEQVGWKPTLWAYYDWASGDNTVNNGYHHYEPLAHKYLGFMDLYGRRNIADVNFQLTMQPHEKVTCLLWYHYFQLQNIHDVPYNVDMSRFAGLGANSAGSRDLGQEIDVTASFALAARLNLLVGYSHFFAGEFYRTTPVPHTGDADFLFTQLTVDF